MIAVPAIGDVLRQAGDDLSKVTRGSVRYRVDSRLRDAAVPTMEHDCLLVVPNRDDLEFPICEVTHAPNEGFPVKLRAFVKIGEVEPWRSGITVSDDRQLLDTLKTIFQHPQTIELIRNLIAAAK
jgi:hypothetical protein